MEKVTFQEIEVDRCVKCRGMWFDALEHEKLKACAESEAIDDATAASRPKLSRSKSLQCPVCHAQMIEMVDARQPHIHFESCKVCHGVFLDAGEFRDYKQETLGEWLRGLLPRK
jgi:uncharacterized protein